jgi:hypothetical protein
VYEPKYKQEYVEGGIKCENCGSVYREGDFPFCRGNPSDHGPMHGFDDPFEPYVDIQLLDRKDPRVTSVNELGIPGVPIRSRSERRAMMKELGLQYGTQKFDEKRGKVLYGGAASSERMKGRQGPQHRKSGKQRWE